jgi:magnesium-transporting ATPase (P-type)
MIQKLLLPHRYKKAGAWMALLGFIAWVAIQQGAMDSILPAGGSWLLITLLVLSFFSFLFGLYFLVFARERNEDEYINNLRLKSFQTAAFSQLVFLILAFVYMFVSGSEPTGDAGLELFLLLTLFLFWICYIVHFNYTMYRLKGAMHEE